MYLRDVYCCHDSIDTQEIKNDAPPYAQRGNAGILIMFFNSVAYITRSEYVSVHSLLCGDAAAFIHFDGEVL